MALVGIRVAAAAAPGLSYQLVPQIWELGAHAQRDARPAEWVPATVPGAVQLDWGKAKQLPDYIFSENYKQYLWMEDSFWTYRTHLTFPPLQPGERLFLVCGGVDYRFQMGIGAKVLHDQEGMFTPVELELDPQTVQAGDEFWVCVYPIPKSFTPNPDWGDRTGQRQQAERSAKPAVSYGWDFHPRLVPLGIWQDTHLEIRPATYLSRTALDYRLSDHFDAAMITVEIGLQGAAEGQVKWELLDAAGQVVAEKKQATAAAMTLTATLAQPKLWWPYDQGTPELYTSRVSLLDARGTLRDQKIQRVGFRRVRLVMNEGAWADPAIFPKSRSHPPMTLEINGRRIFTKGSNWVSPQIFPGLLDRETYVQQLGFAKRANMNLLRCWGGAPVMKDSFFELADEMGLMIWQEFPLACNNYPDDDAYLKVLDQESRSIITGLKHHPSIVLWCGGNELFNDWSGMTEQSLALRLLDSNCFQLDPARPYMMTSPLGGAAHGSYWMIDWSTSIEAWALFQKAHNTAYSEISTGAGLRPLELLRRFIPEDELKSVGPTPGWVAHRLFNANGKPLHLAMKTLETYFGPAASLNESIEQSQFLHGEGLKGVLEEIRRQKMHASMALSWCLNEPWPNAAGCGNLVTWYNTPMPALDQVGLAFRPQLASARIPKMKWSGGETFTAGLWLLSDAPQALVAGQVEAWLKFGQTEQRIVVWDHPALLPNTNAEGPLMSVPLPLSLPPRFQLELRVVGRPELSSTYTLLREPATK